MLLLHDGVRSTSGRCRGESSEPAGFIGEDAGEEVGPPPMSGSWLAGGPIGDGN